MKDMIKKRIQESVTLKQTVLNDARLLGLVWETVQVMVGAFKQKKKVLFCGNGGSAADAQHLAAEFTGRYYFDRPPLFSEALHVNTSYLTAVANDYSYEEVYSRLVQAYGTRGDVLVGLSTSGNSNNIVRALETANALGMITVGMTGQTGGAMKNCCKILINIPSTDTPRIQEMHILLGHIMCELVEETLYGKKA
jgi:D-sedoheptulose 7-phosphate isomerase